MLQGTHHLALESFASVASYPSAQIATQNDKMELLKPGPLQHIGENILAFVLHAASSPKFMKDAHQAKRESTEQKKAAFFDVLLVRHLTRDRAPSCRRKQAAMLTPWY